MTPNFRLEPIVAGAFVAAALAIPATAAAQGDPVLTRVMVRAVAHDAKILGSGVGGARIVIQDAVTGAVLAEGVQQGGTGDTRRIVVDPRPRHGTVFDTPGAAGFLATVPLTRPTVVEISAYGPLATPQSLQRASTTMLLVPGEDVLGEGVILVIHGFTVELRAPESDAAPAVGEAIPVRAHLTMTCGCPTEPGGLWDAEDIRIVVRLLLDGATVREEPLAFSGTTSIFTGTIRAPTPGAYTLQVLAMDPTHANFGMVERPLIVTP